MLAGVICVDGDVEFTTYLRGNLAHRRDLQVVQAMLSRSSEPVRSLVRTHAGTASAQGASSVGARTLDDVLDERAFSPDVLKVDTDGFDGAVLAGATRSLREHAPDVVFEWHPRLLTEAGNPLLEPFEVLRSAGYTQFAMYDRYGREATLASDDDGLRRLAQKCRTMGDGDHHFDVVARKCNAPRSAHRRVAQPAERRWPPPARPPSRPSQARGPRDSVVDHAAGCLGSACSGRRNRRRAAPSPLSGRRTWSQLPPWFVVRDRLQAMDRHLDRVGQAMDAWAPDVVFANACRLLRATDLGSRVRAPAVLYLGEPYRWLYEAGSAWPWSGRPTGARRLSSGLDRRAWAAQAATEARAAAGYASVLVNSRYSRESVQRAYGLEAHVCYPGIDTDLFVPGPRGESPYVISVGALVPEKRPELVVETVSRLERRMPLRWVANVADGATRAAVERKASDLGVELHVDVGVSDEALLLRSPERAGHALRAPAGAVRPGPARGGGQWNPRRGPRGGWCARVGHRRSDRHPVRRRRRARPGVEPHVLGRGPAGPAGPQRPRARGPTVEPAQVGASARTRARPGRAAEDRVIMARTAEPLRGTSGATVVRALGSRVLRLGLQLPFSLLILPLVVHNVPAGVYGAWAGLASAVTLASLADVGVRTELTRRVAQHWGRNDVRSLERELARCLTVSTSTAVGLGALALAATPKIVNLVLPRPPVGLDRSQAELLFAGLVVLAVVALVTQTFAAVLQGVQRGDRENLAWTAGLGAYVVVLVSGLAVGLTWQALLLATAASTFVGTTVVLRSLVTVLPEVRVRWGRVSLGEMRVLLTASGVLVLTQLSDVIDTQVDKLLLVRYTAPAHAAWYEVGSSVVGGLRAFALIGLVILLPGLAELFVRQPDDAVRLYERVAAVTIPWSFVVLGGGAVLGPAFVQCWLGPAYGAAGHVIRMLSIAMLIQAIAAPGRCSPSRSGTRGVPQLQLVSTSS